MKIVDIIREDDSSGRDPSVMADWLRTAGATGSEAAKDQRVIAAAIRIYSAKKELSPDEAFSIAKNQVYAKKSSGADKEKEPFASASHDWKSAMDKKSELRRGFNEPTHGHLRGAGKATSFIGKALDRVTDYIPGAKTFKKYHRKGRKVGDEIGSDLSKAMKGTFTAKDKQTLS